MRPSEPELADMIRALEAITSTGSDRIVASPAMLSTWFESERITSLKENR
jgi:hypothetical protein